MTADQEIEPGPHWWKASALTTAPTLLSKVLVPIFYVRIRLLFLSSWGAELKRNYSVFLLASDTEAELKSEETLSDAYLT